MKSDNIIAFFGGLLVGGVVALLVAPQSGKETREDIRGFVSDNCDRAKDYAKKEGQKVREMARKGKNKVKDEIEHLRAKAAAEMEEMD